MALSPSVQNAPDWERLQKALSVEAERGFSDLVGREFRFHEFLERQFQDPPARLATSDRQRWQNLAAEFGKYPTLTLAQRQHLVAESRRVLLHSQRSLEMRSRSVREPLSRRQPPTVDLRAQVPPAQLRLDQPLSEVRQIGRRGGDRLARLGLYRVQDLLEYFPRDRIDYARQVPIAQLEPGETVTVVAQIQSATFFNSSKNKKLSIFQLTLKDPTGRLKISRFYPGNRYSSSRWQHSHKSQYPARGNGCRLWIGQEK